MRWMRCVSVAPGTRSLEIGIVMQIQTVVIQILETGIVLQVPETGIVVQILDTGIVVQMTGKTAVSHFHGDKCITYQKSSQRGQRYLAIVRRSLLKSAGILE